jgi:UPF0716 protein FxsA
MLLPVIEIAVLFWLADVTSWLTVLALLLGAGVLGAFLSRQQGVRSLSRLSDELRRGQMPTDALFDAVLVSVAAALLILPGLLSDMLAILLLLPPTRHAIKAMVRRSAQGRVVTTHFDRFEPRSGRDEIIDVKVIDTPVSNVD